MKYEVENKYPVGDTKALAELLLSKGAKWTKEQVQEDLYYAHPCRDFAQTDEALRIRQIGDRFYITYKGRKIDAHTKTRREIELPLEGPQANADFGELLEALGFTEAARVRKSRRAFSIRWQGHQVEGALDEVESLGSFLELELVVDDARIEAAQQCIRTLAQSLGLRQPERKSYLELILEK